MKVSRGAWSEVVSARTEGGEPAAPVLTADVRSSTIISLSWTKPDSVGAKITEYELQISAVANSTKDVDYQQIYKGTDLDHSEDDLFPNTPYTFRVRAENGSGAGAWSALKTVSTGAGTGTIPTAVRSLTANVSGSDIVLTWTAPNAGTAPLRYEIQLEDGTDWVAAGTAQSGTAYRYTEGTVGATYRFRVRATNSTGQGPWTVVSKALRINAPGKVTGLKAVRSGSNITLTWTAPSDGGSEITSYRISAKIGDAAWANIVADSKNPHTTTTYTHADTRSGTRYQYRVYALNIVGSSVPSDIANVPAVGTPTNVPGAPTSLTASKTSTGITLTWVAPTDIGSSAITGYRVEQSATGSSGWTRVVSPGATVTSYVHTSAAGDKATYYRVFATNKHGDSPASNIASAGGGATNRKPGAPTGLTATSSGRSIALAWAAPADIGSSAITGYRIERSANGSSGWSALTTVGPTITAHEHTGVGANTTIYYRVFATNRHGDSPASNIANAIRGRDTRVLRGA